MLPLAINVLNAVAIGGGADADDARSTGRRQDVMGGFAGSEAWVQRVGDPVAVDAPAADLSLIVEHFDGKWHRGTYLFIS